MIPSPPELKPTIIQMQNLDNNDESPISEKADVDQNDSEKPKKKRRRSSSSLVSQNEIEKRRREHKTAHSIIEKKRRIRMNREFEALKFLVPACRNNLSTSSNNGEGMYKLTILQATVDYIKYLHNVINIQQDQLVPHLPEWEQEMLDFAKVDVNTDDYRNLDNDFNFNQLFDLYNSQRSSLSSELGDPTSSLPSLRASMSSVSSSAPMGPRQSCPSSRSNHRHNNTTTNPETSSSSSRRLRANSVQHSNDPLSAFQSLPSPIITPELYPRSTSNAPTKTTSLDITNISNYKTQPFKQDFQFPMNPAPSKRSPSMLAVSTTSSTSTTPPSQSRAFEQLPIPALDQDTSKLEAIQELGGTIFETEQTASKALLAMKKDGSVTSIRSLLN